MGAILAIDYGLKRIGLAVSDPSRTFAFPHGVIENKNFDFVLSYIDKVVLEKEIDLIIVGMPYNMPGINKPEGEMVKNVEKFIEKLKGTVKISVETVDERLSSFMAEENLKERGKSTKKLKELVDIEAARLLLEEFIQK